MVDSVNSRLMFKGRAQTRRLNLAGARVMQDVAFFRHAARRVAMASSVLLILSGCASAPPPEPSRAADAVQSAAFRSAALVGSTFDASWWQRFDDPLLTSLIDRSLAANLDVRQALLRVDEARAGSAAAASRLAPTLSLGGSVADQRSGLPTEVKRGTPDVRSIRLAPELGWEIDLFGAARAGADAASAQAEAAAFGVDGARLLVASEVARQYLIWQGARARLLRLQALAQAQADTERLVRSREAAGQASRFDVSRAAGETASLAAQLPPLRSLVSTSEHQLAVLLGVSATTGLAALDRASTPRLPEVPPLAAGQPAELLARRPDLRAAERQMAAESARLREARADLLPKFFISALFGGEDLTINGRDFAPARYSNVALAFTLPIFNAGRLSAAIDRQSARERSATLAYERGVLIAVQEVESSLVALADERERLAALTEAEGQRRTGLRHAESLLREGQTDLLTLLDAQRGVLAAELGSIDSRTQLALGAVQLFKSMGGGWRVDHAAGSAPAGRWLTDAPSPPLTAVPSPSTALRTVSTALSKDRP
jgi:NodT family efflux transporter outer membrane factor (OMF) lipoprotein